jgi:murein DD-endopeptidase MepM/ murein hydrolase activator NlpD
MSSRVSPAETAEQPSFGRRPAHTVNCGRRQFRISPLALWTSASIVTAMTLWTAGSATYFAFRDDMIGGLLTRQGAMQREYEDRITQLRAQIDRQSSRQLLDQEQVEQRIEQLTRRQSTLETRATALNGLPETPAAKARPVIAKPAQPTAEPSAPVVLDRQSELRPGERSRRIALKITRLEESLDRVEAQQNASLLALEDVYGAKALRMRGVLAEIGIDLKKLPSPNQPAGLGGPFVPLTSREANAFERQLQRVQAARHSLDSLSRTLVNVPVRKPLNGELETSSGFGVRVDPFFRAPALHSGLDFRAAPGEPVRVTAAGKVINASWSGGYGRMVEVDHGNGLTTRYGHLSAILVTEDQVVKVGQVIGRVGSTGRSTGPHLHYETRIDGEPVDPIRFLRAGMRLEDRH